MSRTVMIAMAESRRGDAGERVCLPGIGTGHASRIYGTVTVALSPADVIENEPPATDAYV
jgi:hypothetical protein